MITNLSVRLRQLRLDKRLRQDQVARLVGVSKGAISAYETDIRQPSYDVLIRLANLYRVSADYLLGRTDDRTFAYSVAVGYAGHGLTVYAFQHKAMML